MKKYQPEFAVQETWKRESRKLNETCSLLHVQCKNGQQIQICNKKLANTLLNLNKNDLQCVLIVDECLRTMKQM